MSISNRLGPKVGKRNATRKTYGLTKDEEMDMQWKHDKFQEGSGPKRNISTERKFSILVENLHPSATEEDIKASFSHFGTIENAQYKLLMDDQGAHVGSCVITFNRKEAVDEAIKEFDHKWADGMIY